MWEEKADIINEIFANLGLNYYVDEETYQLYHKDDIVSDGFVYVNSVSLWHCSFFKTATFNCTYMQKVGTKVTKNFRIEWNDDIHKESGTFDADFTSKPVDEDEDNIAQKLLQNTKIRIYKKHRFNNAVKALFQAYAYQKRDEELMHIGWMTYQNIEGEEIHGFRGITEELILSPYKKSEKAIKLLTNITPQFRPQVSRLMEVLEQLNAEVSYPIFLAVIYMITDKEILKDKPQIILNISGKYKRDKTPGLLSPHKLANILCNFENNLHGQRDLNIIQRKNSHISLQEPSTSITRKLSSYKDMPVIVHTKKTTVSKNCSDYKNIIQTSKKLADYNEKEKTTFARSFPVILTEKPMDTQDVVNLNITHIISPNIDEKPIIREIQSFYRYYIEQSLPYRKKALNKIFDSNCSKWLGTSIIQNFKDLTSDTCYDERKNYIALVYATALAIFETIMSEKKYNGFVEEFDQFKGKAIVYIKPLLLYPWMEEEPPVDAIPLFVNYVHEILKCNEHLYKTFENDEMVFLQFPECIADFEAKHGLRNTKDRICRQLKKDGFLKTNKSGGYFISRQIEKNRYKVLAIYKESLQDYAVEI